MDILKDNAKGWILDGGLATELERQGHALSTRLWSSELILSDIEAIGKCHRVFLDAGAQIITTAGYQATLQGLEEHGLSHEEAIRAVLDSVRVACTQRNDFHTRTGKPALVAASIGPYGAYLADGSEYSGNYGREVSELVDFHRERIEVLDCSDADILACETVPDLNEAMALARILEHAAKPSWVSFCCRNSAQLRDGTPIEVAARLFMHINNLFAVGINCTAPVHISPLIQRLRSAVPNKRIVVYPNSGEHYHDGTWRGTANTWNFERDAIQWFHEGASIIGGCCRIGPAEISAFASRMEALNGSCHEPDD